MPEHGGRLRAAARTHGIPPHRWLDLSTGIAPWSWPVPAVPDHVWRRLPEHDDGLEDAARTAFGGEAWLAAPGTQGILQNLPRALPLRQVACPAGSYAEHSATWRAAGTKVTEEDDAGLHAAADRAEAVVVVNPDNPSGRRLDPAVLLTLHARLARRGGWLIVDEAFADAAPDASIAALAGLPGLVILRSVGKFFGLAGIRLGFVGAPAWLREQLALRFGPWAVNHPARWLGRRALADRRWQRRQRWRLHAAARRLDALLHRHGLTVAGGTALFRYVRHRHPARIARALAARAVLVRTFDTPPALRFGLPGDRAEWQHLDAALQEITP